MLVFGVFSNMRTVPLKGGKYAGIWCIFKYENTPFKASNLRGSVGRF